VKLLGLTIGAWGQTVSHPLDATHTQLVLSNWAQDYPDPQDYCSLLLRSGQPLAVGGWSNRQYDHLVGGCKIAVVRL
jgi:ABC-type oligopeptide transport system substrate-binding subunit